MIVKAISPQNPGQSISNLDQPNPSICYRVMLVVIPLLIGIAASAAIWMYAGPFWGIATLALSIVLTLGITYWKSHRKCKPISADSIKPTMPSPIPKKIAIDVSRAKGTVESLQNHQKLKDKLISLKTLLSSAHEALIEKLSNLRNSKEHFVTTIDFDLEKIDKLNRKISIASKKITSSQDSKFIRRKSIKNQQRENKILEMQENLKWIGSEKDKIEQKSKLLASKKQCLENLLREIELALEGSNSHNLEVSISKAEAYLADSSSN